MKPKKVPFLHCAKCNLSFIPKLPRQIPTALRRLRAHRKNCNGKCHIIDSSSSTTDKNGRHHIVRTWRIN